MSLYRSRAIVEAVVFTEGLRVPGILLPDDPNYPRSMLRKNHDGVMEYVPIPKGCGWFGGHPVTDKAAKPVFDGDFVVIGEHGAEAVYTATAFVNAWEPVEDIEPS